MENMTFNVAGKNEAHINAIIEMYDDEFAGMMGFNFALTLLDEASETLVISFNGKIEEKEEIKTVSESYKKPDSYYRTMNKFAA